MKLSALNIHAGLMLTAMCLTSTWAQTAWPDKPIRIVVPFTPGGGTDAVTRLVAEKITFDTKWSFLVDNKPGAGGNIGLDMVAKSKPDGYTLGMGQTSNLAINPSVIPKMPFDPQKDLVGMVVRTESPWKSLDDMIKAAKAKPGEIKQALAGTGTVGHLAGEMLAKKSGVKLLNVPYKGAAPAINDLLGGQTDFMFATPQAVLGMLQGGKLRALAVTSRQRITALNGVPTVAEQGYKDFEAVDWKVIVAPAGTPLEIVKRINAVTTKALQNQSVLSKLAEEGSTPLKGSPEEVAKYIKNEQAEWGTLIRESGIKFE